MHAKRSITASLAAILGAAVLAGPAAAVPADSHNEPNSWYAGESTITGSRSDSQTSSAGPKANVYVPPASQFNGTVAPAAPSWPANPQPIEGHAAAGSPSSTGFDWGSAGIGAAAAIAAFLIALGGAAGVRRRRRAQATA
jgi:hypothetical protein